MLIIMFTMTAVPCTNGTIQLTGSSPVQGLVEVCLNNSWGTICNYGFDASDAAVVCRQLGYLPAGMYSIA